ncbi:MAG TPA: ABC transporter substrate-binding protein [Candidatus Acidoferrales bacterium]|nr:ABC transporter substrate-binding protein [Candidatus Acidoferrales bacterium]
MKLRLCLYLAAISVVMAAAAPLRPARRPRYGGTLRVEIGAIVKSLDPSVAAANPEEAEAKDELDALLYDRRSESGAFAGAAGSGPFRLSAWEAGKSAVFAANEDYREGRPFVDSIEIQMGRSPRDRLLDLELNKADFAQIPAELARQATDRGVRVSTSQPDELLALVFLKGRTATENARVREAIVRCIDQAAIVNFILQKEGEPAGGLLPQWSSGTAFLFVAEEDARHAKEIWSQISPSPKLVLGYDSADALEQSVAERIVVNAKEAGISLMSRAMPNSETTSAHTGNVGPRGDTIHVDARLIRLRMPSPLPSVSLTSFADTLGPTTGIEVNPVPEDASPEDIYNCERSIISSGRVAPLVWLPQVYGLSARVHDWKQPAAGGSWPLADVWLDSMPETH